MLNAGLKCSGWQMVVYSECLANVQMCLARAGEDNTECPGGVLCNGVSVEWKHGASLAQWGAWPHRYGQPLQLQQLLRSVLMKSGVPSRQGGADGVGKGRVLLGSRPPCHRVPLCKIHSLYVKV